MTTSPISLSDAVGLAIQNILNTVHTSFPAQVISYDYSIQKAVLQPCINKSYLNGSNAAMPILTNVPVIFPRSGGASLSFPVSVGDTMLVVCAERSIANWLQSGCVVTPNDRRKFDLSDGMAIPGLFPFSSASPAPNNSDMVLQYQGSKIIIDSSGNIKIETSNTVAIGNSAVELIQTLITLLSAFTTLTSPAPYPTLAAAGLSAKNALATIVGTIP